MSKISQVEIFKVNIPFKIVFHHALKKRDISESIFTKITLDNGVTGFGESLPRSYVTGNTQDSVFKELGSYSRSLIGLELEDSEKGINLIKELKGIEGESRCALEIGLLDCLGKVSSKPVSELLGTPVNEEFVYSLVISGESMSKVGLISVFARAQGYKFVKIKVGLDNDIARIRLARRLLGNVDIRVDANGAWDVTQALDAINNLRPFRISCIEQPTPKNDHNAMQEVADFCPEPIMADESLCTRDEALTLAQTRVCDMFNVRLSKCGGIFRSLDIIKIAEESKLGYQIGCHVGESGILSAAARHMASVVKNTKYLEGSYSKYLLKEDIIEEDLTPKRGMGYTLKGAGLGVTVKEDVLRKYTEEGVSV
jgi:L-Ala-D/L-Glu epimerase